MPVTRLLSLIVVVLGLSAPQPDPPATQPEPPVRVIVRVSRHREVMGHIRFEDENLIVVRMLNGGVESFPKSQLHKIVRLVDPKPGQEGVVVLRNGQQRVGVILEDSFEQVVMDIDGIKTTLTRESVEEVILRPTFEDRYALYKAATRSPQQHLELCQWLLDLRRYDLAHTELRELATKAVLPEAQRLLKIVEAQLALQATKNGAGSGKEPTRNRGSKKALPSNILTHEDVNLIRVYEIDFERPPRVAVDADSIRRMIANYSTSDLIGASDEARRSLFRAEPLELVELMFQLRARELYPDINVLSEPWALNLFRRRVHDAWLLNSCATSRCHGGVEAGRFFLHRRRHKDERVRYTNLLILLRQELDPQWSLVDFTEPRRSLIIQYGLPRSNARKPHPDVRGWKPVFGPGGQRMLRDTVTWIDGMMTPRPEYPVNYQPPVLHVPSSDAQDVTQDPQNPETPGTQGPARERR